MRLSQTEHAELAKRSADAGLDVGVFLREWLAPPIGPVTDYRPVTQAVGPAIVWSTPTGVQSGNTITVDCHRPA